MTCSQPCAGGADGYDTVQRTRFVLARSCVHRMPAEGGEAHGGKGGGRGRRWGAAKGIVHEAGQDVGTLFRHPVYVCTIAGQTLYTGALPFLPAAAFCVQRSLQQCLHHARAGIVSWKACKHGMPSMLAFWFIKPSYLRDPQV